MTRLMGRSSRLRRGPRGRTARSPGARTPSGKENGAMADRVSVLSGPLSAEAPVGMLVVNALAKGASRLHGAILMVEKDEDDAIHQVRVACRRLRSDKLLAGDWARQLRADLAALALACGEARDLEVIAALVGETVSSEDDQDHVDTILTTLTLVLERAAARSAEV